MAKGKDGRKHSLSGPGRRLLVGLLVLLAPFSLCAEQSRQAAVLLAGRAGPGEETSAFEPVIWSAIETTLEYAGLTVIRFQGEAGGEDAELLSQADSRQADYLLTCEYTSRDELLELGLRWIDVEDNREAAFLSEQMRVGLSLDAVLSRVTREVIAAAQPRLKIPLSAEAVEKGGAAEEEVVEAGGPAETLLAAAQPPEARPEAPQEAQPAGQPAVAPESQPEAQPARPPAAQPETQPEAQPEVQPDVQPVERPEAKPKARPREQPATGPAVPVSPPETEPAAQPAGRRRPLTFSFTAAPFLADGLARDYLPSGYGLFPTISLWYRWSFAKSYFGAGLSAGLNVFRSEGPLAFSDTALLPAGLEIRYGVDSRPVGLYLRLAGGPALFSIDPNDTGRLIKLTYYGQAGIGVTLPLGPAFGFILEAGYSIFLEDQEEPIRGLAPAAGVYIRP